MQDAEYWKMVALWLANCHAATCEYDGSLKATSKHRRNRLKSIAEKAADALDGKMPSAAADNLDWVRDRLRKCGASQ